MFRTLTILILIGTAFSALPVNVPIDLIKDLDSAIDNSQYFNYQRSQRISVLQQKLREAKTDSDRFAVNDSLASEYMAYQSDSAAYYLERNIGIAMKSGKHDERVMADKMHLSYLFSSAGYYLPAVDILHTIDPTSLSRKSLARYYECYEKAYSEMSEYGMGESVVDYRRLASTYRDSLMEVLPKNCELRLRFDEQQLREQGKYAESLAINDRRLKMTGDGTALYALVMFHRSLIFQSMGDKEDEMVALAKSAITDVRLATKDHASLWMLAKILYDNGDIDRAYRYMKFSWEDTKFFNAPLRSWQSAGVLSLIEQRYSDEIQLRNMQLKIFMSVVSALFILLLAAAFFIYKQNKRLRTSNEGLTEAHKAANEANAQLRKLNDALVAVNDELNKVNSALRESNNIKEVYITRFIKLCSGYIDKLDRLRTTVSSKLATGQMQELKKLVKSKHFIDEEVKEFYSNFDSAFLHIFPNYVEQFNSLLADDEKIVLKDGELLNPELRIFALIRLGFNDSSQIAEFLRYSVNTIYNYRAKAKNKAKVNRDDFENLIKKIH